MCPSSRAHPARRRRASVALSHTHTHNRLDVSLSVSLYMSVCVCILLFSRGLPSMHHGCGVALLDSHVDWMKVIWAISAKPSTE